MLKLRAIALASLLIVTVAVGCTASPSSTDQSGVIETAVAQGLETALAGNVEPTATSMATSTPEPVVTDMPTAIPTPVPTSTPTPTATPRPKPTATPIPNDVEWVQGSSQDSSDQSEIEFYIKMMDVDKARVQYVPGANFEISIADINGDEVYDRTFVRISSQSSGWSTIATGEQHVGYVISVKKSDIQRSYVSSNGFATINIVFPDSIFSGLEVSVSGLPEASEAEKTARSNELFESQSIAMSGNSYNADGWRVTPKFSGCHEGFNSYGGSLNGIRVDLSIQNLENTLNSFNDDGNLLLPSGLIVDHNYDSSISGLQLLPNSEGTGSFIFENVECIQGTYTLIMSDWLGNIYAQEQFSLLP